MVNHDSSISLQPLRLGKPPNLLDPLLLLEMHGQKIKHLKAAELAAVPLTKL